MALAQGVTLSDIFKLLDLCPGLRSVFRRDFAEALWVEAGKGPLPQSRGNDPEELGDIEYLELYRSWTFDTAKKAYASTLRLDLHGVGQMLKTDAPGYGAKARERIEWSVSMTPLRELLALPLRLREAFRVVEGDIDAKGYGEVIAQASCAELTLGQVIHGLLYELSFHGTPEDQMDFRDELLRCKAGADTGRAELRSAEGLFTDLYEPGVALLFEETGGLTVDEIARAVRALDDDVPVGVQLEARFGGRVQVRDPYQDRGGREFRKAFRASRR